MALTVKFRGDATQLEKTLASVQSKVGSVSKTFLKLTAAGVGFGAALAGIGGAVSLTEKGLDAIKDASSKAAGLESLQLTFETLTGSGQKAADMIRQFREEAQKSPLSSNDYAQAGKTLMAFGGAAEDTVPILKTLDDVSLGNSERFLSLATAFAQTQAAGRLMGQEVLQFVNAGFNPLYQISKKTGESMAALKKRMEDGAVSADEVTQAFRDATAKGGLFFGAIQHGAETTEGKIAKFKDTIDTLKISFGSGLNEGLKTALDAADSQLDGLEGKFADFGKNFGEAISQAVQGQPDIFLNVGKLIGEYILAGAETSISQMWTDAGVGIANAFGANLKNESFSDTFQRHNEGVQAAQAALRDSLPGGSAYAANEEQIRQQELMEQKRLTDELIKLHGTTKEGQQKVLEALRNPKPMTSR